MRKCVVLLFFLTMATVMVSVSIAATTAEMSGIISDVKIYPRQSAFGNPAITVIEFDDGRIVAFEGIYVGVVFEKGKKHTIVYDSDWIIRKVEKDK